MKKTNFERKFNTICAFALLVAVATVEHNACPTRYTAKPFVADEHSERLGTLYGLGVELIAVIPYRRHLGLEFRQILALSVPN